MAEANPGNPDHSRGGLAKDPGEIPAKKAKTP
jgi:hypothetical protein